MVSLTIAWIRSPSARSPGDIAASAESTASSPSAAAFSSRARALIAAFSSAVNPSDCLSLLLVLLLAVVLIVLLSLNRDETMKFVAPSFFASSSIRKGWIRCPTNASA